MKPEKDIESEIFQIKTDALFETVALEVFRFQFRHCILYRTYCEAMSVKPDTVNSISEIPFLPIEFFKTKTILCEGKKASVIFESSGTSGSEVSKHYIASESLYLKSLLSSFELFFGSPDQFTFFALLPSYLERGNSSLVYMVNELMRQSGKAENGFYLNNLSALSENLVRGEQNNKKAILIGVTYALLDFAEQFPMKLKHTILMETGGMKGRRREMIREEVHSILKHAFHLDNIYSEYSMTELLSQAYSIGSGKYRCPPWMKILIRDAYDPSSVQKTNKTGGINIIDLANLYSCSFISTQDLGKLNDDGTFEVLGRFDSSELRGCNLMFNT